MDKLRDRLAEKAMQSLLGNERLRQATVSKFGEEKFFDVAAESCYKMADAMLKARGENKLKSFYGYESEKNK